MAKSLKQKLTYPLAGILFLLVLSAVLFILFNRFTSKQVKLENITVDTRAVLKLNVLEQISKKNGIKEWELKAKSATLLKDENRAVLEDVNISFFTKEGKQVILQSNKGILDTKSHDMTFFETVIVDYDTFVLRTDKLHYNKKKHIIYSDVRVLLTKEDSSIEADSMETDLNQGRTVLKGNVKGKFSENFKVL